MTKIKRLHFKDLNGLRFIAFIPVFIFICSILLKVEKNDFSQKISELFNFISITSFDFFFFLSAFLLTSIALREYKYHKTFSLKKFYIRRLLRILPIIVVAFLFAFYFHDKIITFLKLTPIPANSLKSYLIGIPNYIAPSITERLTYSMVIWVVFMFMQFYFVWGIILKYFKPFLNSIGILLILIGITARIVSILNGHSFYFDTLSYGVLIGMGTIMANYVRQGDKFSSKFKTLSKLQLRLIYSVGFLITICLYPLFRNSYVASIIPLFNALFFGFIIMEQTFGKNSSFKIRKFKLLNRLGRISYALLIFTPIVGTILIIAFESLDKGMESLNYKLIFVGVTFLLSWAIADLSYNYFEKIFMRIKRNFKRV
jgi:peptidoglycan/LPS O-acetylase OafA/YrhL